MMINWMSVLEVFLQGFVWGMGVCFAFFVVLLITKKMPKSGAP
jgi:hypothetical protein